MINIVTNQSNKRKVHRWRKWISPLSLQLLARCANRPMKF